MGLKPGKLTLAKAASIFISAITTGRQVVVIHMSAQATGPIYSYLERKRSICGRFSVPNIRALL